MSSFVKPPDKIPWYLRPAIAVANRKTGKQLELPGLLAWFPKGAIGSAVLEGLTPSGGKDMPGRLLKLVRIVASLSSACPFCLDMNARELEQNGITADEIRLLMEGKDLAKIESFSSRERMAVEYARLISATPLQFPADFVARLQAEFLPREIVILALTASQVNYWARLVQALGVPPAGFSEYCTIPTPGNRKRSRTGKRRANG